MWGSMNLAREWSQEKGVTDVRRHWPRDPSFILARIPFPGTDAPAVVNCLHILARSLDARYGLGTRMHLIHVPKPRPPILSEPQPR